LVIEYGLKGAGVRFQASFYTPERERGYALRPGAEGWNVGEHENYVRINSRGQHDREHDLNRPVNTIRVAILGDSVTEAMQIPLEKAYFSEIERELNAALAKDGQKVEVLSFGVGGYGLGPQYLTLKEQVWRYDPQIILAVAPIDGLILRSSRRLYPGDSFGAPFFDLHSGELRPDSQSERRWADFVPPSQKQMLSANLMNQSCLLSLFNSARAKAWNDVNQWESASHAKAESPSSLPADYWLTYPFLGPANPELKDAFKTAKALLLAMRDEAASHHAEFWLFFQKQLGVETLFRTDRLICDFASDNEIPHLALAPELARLAAERSLTLHGFKGTPKNSGHMNELGHQIVGRIMAEELRDNSAVLRRSAIAKNH